MKESERLRAAKRLIENPENWLQEVYADEDDISLATCFCSLGAVKKVRGELADSPDANPTTKYLSLAVADLSSWRLVESFNDNSRHAEVMAMWDLAIELAEKDESK